MLHDQKGNEWSEVNLAVVEGGVLVLASDEGEHSRLVDVLTFKSIQNAPLPGALIGRMEKPSDMVIPRKEFVMEDLVVSLPIPIKLVPDKDNPEVFKTVFKFKVAPGLRLHHLGFVETHYPRLFKQIKATD